MDKKKRTIVKYTVIIVAVFLLFVYPGILGRHICSAFQDVCERHCGHYHNVHRLFCVGRADYKGICKKI